MTCTLDRTTAPTIETPHNQELVLFIVGVVQGLLKYTDNDGHLDGKWAVLANLAIPYYQVPQVFLQANRPETYVDDLGGAYTLL